MLRVYVSELRLPSVLVIITKVIYEYGDTVEWFLLGKTEEMEEKLVPVSYCPRELTRERPGASEVRGQRVTVWGMTQPIL
jgi:hypothetical protein